jgi:ATP-dependent helicase Lhr and Lhr-like helicase
VNLDEAINLYKITHPQTRDKNYETILKIYNDTLQGNIEGLYITFGGTVEFLEDERRGLFSYGALKRRLETNKYETSEFRDLSQPVIKLTPLKTDETFLLLQRLRDIHAVHNDYETSITDDEISIEEFAKVRPRIIGLSATIGNFDLVKEWINFKYPENVNIIEDKSSDKQLLYSLMYFETDKDNKKPVELFEDMRDLTKEQKSIIFCNSRGNVEETTVFLNRLAERQGAGESYYAHHSSIDKKEREYVEKVMSETKEPKSVVATSSLELGIDIGNVDLVIQLDSSYTVSSLKQRLGRSGRERDAEQMLQLYSTSKDRLLQSIAVMELVLDKRIEPATGYTIPYDILFHQIISICAEKNGVTIKQLLGFIENNDIFHSLDSSKGELLINHMIQNDILEKLSGNGELIVGLEGERILRSKEFYSVFMTNEEYEVVEGTHKIGN